MKIRTIIGIACVAVGLTITFFAGQTRTLICHRIEDRIDCRFEDDFLGIGVGSTSIPDLQSAEVEGDTSYRVLLVAKGGNVPMTSSTTSNRDSKQETVDRINAFINNPRQPSFELRQEGWFGLIFGSCLSLVGFYILLRKGPLIPDWLHKFLDRKIIPLGELLDDRQFEMKILKEGFRMVGLYRGREIRFGYSPDNWYGPEEFHIELSCQCNLSFMIHQWSLKKGIDKVKGLTEWMGIPGVKDNVESLVLAEHMDYLQLEDGYLRVKYARSRTFIVPIPLNDGLATEMSPSNVALVLLKLETLVQSLESLQQ